MEHQDWNPLTIKAKKLDPKSAKIKAERTGNIETQKRKVQNSHLRKVELEDDVQPIEKVSTDIKLLIQKARQEKNLTQKELANKVNVKPEIIRDIESGKAMNDKQILVKMQKVLGVKLVGNNIGTKF